MAWVGPFLQLGQGLVVEGVADPHLEDIVSTGEAVVSWSEAPQLLAEGQHPPDGVGIAE